MKMISFTLHQKNGVFLELILLHDGYLKENNECILQDIHSESSTYIKPLSWKICCYHWKKFINSIFQMQSLVITKGN